MSNYRHISVEQAINADKALWVKVSDDTRGKVQSKTGEEKQFDLACQKIAEHPEVLHHLTPLQASSSHRQDFSHGQSQGPKGKLSGTFENKGKSSKGKGKPGPGITQSPTTVKSR